MLSTGQQVKAPHCPIPFSFVFIVTVINLKNHVVSRSSQSNSLSWQHAERIILLHSSGCNACGTCLTWALQSDRFGCSAAKEVRTGSVKQTWAHSCGSGSPLSRWSSSRRRADWCLWSASSSPPLSTTACVHKRWVQELTLFERQEIEWEACPETHWTFFRQCCVKEPALMIVHFYLDQPNSIV